MSELISDQWLSPGFDDLLEAEPELARGYALEPYPGQMVGEGNWIILYLGNADCPVGLLWVRPDDGIGIEPVAGANMDLLTIENLRLRVMKDAGADIYEAYSSIVSRYTTSDEETGPLTEAEAYVAR